MRGTGSVACDGVVAVRKHGGHPQPGERDLAVPDGVDAPKEPVEAADPERNLIASWPRPGARSCRAATTPSWRAASAATASSTLDQRLGSVGTETLVTPRACHARRYGTVNYVTIALRIAAGEVLRRD